MFLIDSHCHFDQLNYHNLHQDVNDVINKARARDVRLILAVCTTLQGYSKMKNILIGHRKDIVFSCGIHPLNLNEPYDFTKLRNLSSNEGVVALGETGLDYYYQQDNKKQQQNVFREHIRIGLEQNKPVIVHTRSARKDTLEILYEERANECGGVLHCFTEDCNTARTVLELGFYISFSGIVTFRNAKVSREVARYVPLDRLLIETDSPYLTPVPYRGKENQPAYAREVAEYLAMLKGITLKVLATTTTANFSRLFHVNIEKNINFR